MKKTNIATANPESVEASGNVDVEKKINCDFASFNSAMKVVESVVPSLNKLLEENIIKLSEAFVSIASVARNLEKIKNTEVNFKSPEVISFIETISEDVNKGIMAMQFQDRLSQNLVIIENISRSLNNYIEDEISIYKNDDEQRINKKITDEIIQILKLGELRDIYLKYMIERDYIKSADEIEGAKMPEQVADEVELF